MEFENLILEKEDYLAILYINRPEAMNALNTETLPVAPWWQFFLRAS